MVQKKVQSFFLYGIFAFYIVLFLSIIVFKNVSLLELFSESRPFYRSLNIMPLNTIIGYLSGKEDVSQTVVWNNILGNIAMFVPVGIYLQLFRENKKITYGILTVFLISFSIEILQFSFGIGVSDIDDIILNCVGGLIGILLYQLLEILIKNRDRVRTIITVLSSVIGIPILILKAVLLINN